MNLEALLNLIFALVPLLLIFIFGWKKTKSLKSRVILTVFIGLPIGLFIIGFLVPTSIFGRTAVQNFLLKFGIFSVFGLLLLQIIQVIIPPLDHNVVGMIGGFLFGPWLGFAYNLIGRIAGSVIVFAIARRYGPPFLQKVITEAELTKYDRIWNKSLPFIFFAYWSPFFPDDTISYLAGSSKINFRTFIIMLVLGHPGGTLGISYMGALGATKMITNPSVWAITIGTLIIGLLFFSIRPIRTKILGLNR